MRTFKVKVIGPLGHFILTLLIQDYKVSLSADKDNILKICWESFKKDPESVTELKGNWVIFYKPEHIRAWEKAKAKNDIPTFEKELEKITLTSIVPFVQKMKCRCEVIR